MINEILSKQDIQYDFSVFGTEYFLLDKKEKIFLEKEYISKIKSNSPQYLEEFIKLEEPTLKHPFDYVSTIFDTGKKISLVASKIALYDLTNSFFTMTEEGPIPLCSLEERLDAVTFEKYL